MNIKLTLGERLKDLRVERHLKLETLAEQTGLSKSALSKYESDDVTDLSIYAVTTLAEFYGVTTDYASIPLSCPAEALLYISMSDAEY